MVMIIVIGGGPAGSHAACLLARAKMRVIVLEEHPEIGKPLQCTGIVTKELLEYVKPCKGVVVNRVSQVVLHSPSNSVKLTLRHPDLVLDRTAFDAQLAASAKKAGARYYLNTKARKIIKKGKLYEIHTNRGRLKGAIVIGADGPLSTTARALELHKNRRFLFTKQAIVNQRNSNEVHFFLLKGGFAWLVPENLGRVRAGVAVLKNPEQAFTEFASSVRLNEPVTFQGGVIPLFSLFGKRQGTRSYLVGDAGGFVKATTGGGIVQALLSARLCAYSIINKSSYSGIWLKRMAPQLLLHRFAFDILCKQTNKGIDSLVEMLARERVARVLESQSRDSFLAMALRLMLVEPRLIWFAAKSL